MTALLNFAAMDIGFGTNKTSPAPAADGTNTVYEFASCAIPVTDALAGQEIFGCRPKRVIVPVGSALYEVCTNQLSADDLSGQILHDRYVDSDEYEAIFKAGLVRLGAKRIRCLVMGLPMKSPASAKSRIEEMGTGHIDLGQYGCCFIERTVVMSQAIGAFQAHVFDIANRDAHRVAELADGSALLIDVGHKTLDWVRIDRRRPISHYSGSIPMGVSAILQKMTDLIANEHQISPPTISQLTRAMRERHQSIKVHGEKLCLKAYRYQATPIVDAAIDEMLNRAGDTTFLDTIILCGGGAGYYRERLQKKLERNIEIMRDPAKANLRGYLLIAESMAA